MRKSDLKNGMIVKYNDGTSRVCIDGGLWTEYGIAVNSKEINDDLTSSISDEFDIDYIYYKGKLIWKREEVDWSKVPFGTRVVCWDFEGNHHEGKFIKYDEDDFYKYRVLVEGTCKLEWRHCRLIEKVITEDEFAIDLEDKYSTICYDKDCTECSYDDKKINCRFKFILENYNLTRK